jgi:hypothetical protein
VSEEALREEMLERFNQVERRLDDAVASLTDPRLEKASTALSAGITRLERKLDRILALVVEARGRSR